MAGYQWHHDLTDLSGEPPEFNTINWHDTTHFDSEDDYYTGCRNVNHCQQEQSYSGLRSPADDPTQSSYEMTVVFKLFADNLLFMYF